MHFLCFFCVMAGQKFVFWFGRCVFVLFRIFDFLKIVFRFFIMIGSRYLNRMGIIRKRIKIPIFSKKNFLAITVLLLLLVRRWMVDKVKMINGEQHILLNKPIYYPIVFYNRQCECEEYGVRVILMTVSKRVRMNVRVGRLVTRRWRHTMVWEIGLER